MARNLVFLGLLVLGTAGISGGLQAAPGPPDQPPRPLPSLTAEGAREALLELMQTTRDGVMTNFDRKAWARIEVRKNDSGGYSFGGLFDLRPAQARYTLTVGPRAPGQGGCLMQYEGSFVLRHGRWVATPPRLRLTALTR